ncbi:MAG: hypothetical protein AAF550_04200 [Myxococcota bacterium]
MIVKNEQQTQVLQFSTEAEVYFAAFSPKGQFIVLGCRDHTLQVRTMNGGRLVRTIKTDPRSPISSAALAPDQPLIATGREDGRVVIYSLTLGGCKFE